MGALGIVAVEVPQLTVRQTVPSTARIAPAYTRQAVTKSNGPTTERRAARSEGGKAGRAGGARHDLTALAS
jgi:hypothetical protein